MIYLIKLFLHGIEGIYLICLIIFCKYEIASNSVFLLLPCILNFALCGVIIETMLKKKETQKKMILNCVI